MDIGGSRLQEHLGHTGTAAEVAVYLEWCVGIPQVGIGASAATGVVTPVFVGRDVAQQLLQHAVGSFSIAQPGIEVDAPSRTPSRGLHAL